MSTPSFLYGCPPSGFENGGGKIIVLKKITSSLNLHSVNAYSIKAVGAKQSNVRNRYNLKKG